MGEPLMNYGWLLRSLFKSNITVPSGLDIIIGPRKNLHPDPLARLGDSLVKVRRLQNEQPLSVWSRQHWKTVERQLERKIKLARCEMDYQ